jgi:hypothetical protein
VSCAATQTTASGVVASASSAVRGSPIVARGARTSRTHKRTVARAARHAPRPSVAPRGDASGSCVHLEAPSVIARASTFRATGATAARAGSGASRGRPASKVFACVRTTARPAIRLGHARSTSAPIARIAAPAAWSVRPTNAAKTDTAWRASRPRRGAVTCAPCSQPMRRTAARVVGAVRQASPASTGRACASRRCASAPRRSGASTLRRVIRAPRAVCGAPTEPTARRRAVSVMPSGCWPRSRRFTSRARAPGFGG